MGARKVSRTDPKCYPVDDPMHWRGSKSDRSPSLHEMFESWKRLESFDFGAHLRGEETDRGGFQRMTENASRYRFMPERSTVLRRAETAAKRVEKRKQKEMHRARLDHEINRLLNEYAAFPQPKTSN